MSIFIRKEEIFMNILREDRMRKEFEIKYYVMSYLFH